MTDIAAREDVLAAKLAARLAKARTHKAPVVPAYPPRPGSAGTPLSAAQRQLWFTHQWAPDSAAYHIPVAWRLRGPLDTGRLARALDGLVARHEILRTRYPAVDGSPTAVVDPVGPLPLTIASAGSDLANLARQPFALDRDWPLRAHLLPVNGYEHLLLLTAHHIAVDGWSVGLLADSLGTLYSGRSTEDCPQYADVTYALAGDDHGDDLAYWLDRLADAPPPVRLPPDRPAPATLGDAGARYAFELDDALTARVRAWGTAERATSFMTLFAGFAALVARYTGESDLAIASPVAGRDAPGVARVVGCFLNTLVLRTRVPAGVTGRDLLAQVRADTLAGTEHAGVPYEDVVAALPRRPATHHLQFVATNVPRVPLTLDGLDVEEVWLDPGATKLDLSLAVEDLGGPTMGATFTYSTELFDAATIERFAAHYRRLLGVIAADPGAPVDAHDLLDADERAMLLAEPARPRVPASTVVDAYLDWAERVPDQPAVVARDGVLTYAQLTAASADLAARLRADGVGAGVTVALDATRTRDFAIGLLGILRAGGAYVPVEPDQPPARRAAILAAAGATRYVSGGASGAATTDLPLPEPGDLAYVIFTSGSTGTPKGVAVEHGHLAAYVWSVAERLAATPGATYAVCSTLAADLAYTMVFTALATGGTLRLLDADESSDPLAMAAALREYPADYLKVVPSHLAALLSADDAGVLPRRCVVLGGESASWELIDRIRALRPGLRVVNHYGPTETTVGVTTYEVPDGPDRPAVVPLGRPMPHVAARILDGAGRPVPIGVPGELYLGGAAVARGYVNADSERFTDLGGARYYRTGDRARWHADGTIEFLGRVDRQLKIRGYRVEPGEIEAVLRTAPGVEDAVVEGVDGRLVAYIAGEATELGVWRGPLHLAKRLQGPPPNTDPAGWLAARLPAHMVPATFVTLDALPLTANGKVDRARLPRPEAASSATGTAPHTPMQRLVASVYRDVLGCPPPSIEDDFFALGGHSLLATRVVSRLRQAVPVPVTLPLLFAHPTVGGLAAQLRDTATGATEAGPAPSGEPAVISYPQRRLWFLDQAVPGNPAYNLPYVLRIDGDLDVDALRRALNDVVARHDVLRTRFATVAGEPVPLVESHVHLAVPLVDHPDDVQTLVDAEFRTGFDLAAGPLVRARLLKTADATHLLLLTFHHIVFDGWSLSVFVGEVAALLRGESLAPPALRYADYARWQAHADVSADLAYWRQALDGAPARLDLPTDRPRPPRPSYVGGALPVSVPADVAARASEIGGTAFMVLLAAYQVVLARFAGVDDLVVGTPVAGRDHPDLEPMLGFFVNMVPLRGQPKASLTFREYVRQVRETAVAGFAHAGLPFERLVEELRPERDPSRAPVFSTMLSLRNTPGLVADVPGLTITELDGPTGVAKYDVSLVLADDGAGRPLRGALEYASDLFDGSTAARLVEAFQTLLDAALANPDTQLGDLPLMGEAQRDLVTRGWNDTAAPIPTATVAELVAQRAAERPDAVALVDDDREWTYAELDGYANRLAHRLRTLGVAQGTLVAVCAARSARVVAAFLGILRAGAAYVPLDPSYPPARLRYLLDDSRAAVLVTDGSAPDGFAGLTLDIDDLRGATTGPTVSSDLAYVIYTSGSTGQPKGVAIEHRGLSNFIASLTRSPGLRPDDVWLSVATFSFDMSGLDIWLPLTCGARLVVASRPTAMDGAALARRLASSGATHLQATPVTWRLLLEAGWPGDPGLTAMCGGEALPAELAATLLARTRAVWNLYGPTETTVYSTVKQVTGLPVTVGTPIANTSILVLDARGLPVPIGVTGELYIGGAGLAREYHRRPDLTAERFVAIDGDRYYRTGDLARWCADGELDVLGRNDGQIKLRGYRIELREIEATLATHAGVDQAVVDVRPDASGEPQLVAYVVGAAGDLRGWLAERLPAYMVPSAYVPLDRLPTTPNGKVDRNALPAPSAPAPTAAATFETPTQRRVAAAFALVLGHNDFGPDDDFFAVGGESMRAVRVVREVGADVSVLDLFTYPTVRALAAFVERGERSEARLLHRLTPARTTTASLTVLCVPFGGGNAIAYKEVAAHAPADWDVYAIQPPGHDPARPDEPLMPMAPLADACAADVLATVSGPVLVYGHCVGAALAIQLARRLEQAGAEVVGVSVGAAFPTSRLPGPLDLLARLAPGRRVSDRAVAETLRTMGGLGEELPAAQRKQLARAVRHDARQGELSYTEELRGTGPVPLRAPIQVIVGEKDPITEFYPERAHEWGAFGSTVDLAVVPGSGHFFQRTASAATLVNLLRTQVRRWRSGEPPANPPAVPPRARLGAFGIVTLGQLISLIGTGLTTFGLGVWTYQMVGTVTAFAAIAAFGIVPAVALAPVAGAVADRYNRRRVMVGADLVGLASAVALALLLWSGRLALWHLYVLVVLSAAAATFRQPAYLAAVAQLTPKRYLGQANGIVVLGTAAGTIVAQLAGGILVVSVGVTGVAAIDIASYALALLSLLVVRFPDLAFVKRDGPLVREVVEGWRFIARRRPLIALTVFFAVANALGSVVLVLVTPMVLAFGTPRLLGTVLAAQGAGLLAGGALMAVWGGARRRSAGMIASVALFAMSAMLIGVRPHAFFPIAGMFGVGVCAALINAHWLSLVQVKVGHELMGRILATCLMLARTIMPIGYLVTGPLVDRVVAPATQRPGPVGDLLRLLVGSGHGRGLAATVLLTGLVALAWTLAGYRYRELREADDALPDAALPDATPEGIARANTST